MTLEPNEFHLKTLNHSIDKEANIIDFYVDKHSSYNLNRYITKIEFKGTIFYSTLWTEIDDGVLGLEDIANALKHDMTNFLTIINDPNSEDLINIVSSALSIKYQSERFFDDTNFHDGWRGVNIVLKDYIELNKFNNSLEAYAHCILHFRDFFLDEFKL